MKAIYAVPATAALVYRAYSHNSLTPLGILAATLTAAAHAAHPSNVPFILLLVFFLAGTRVTRVKADVKAGLTLHSRGSSSAEGPRTHVQVLANSLVASLLSLLQAYHHHQAKEKDRNTEQVGRQSDPFCYGGAGAASDLVMIGIVANYAAVCADTFSSELGILARGRPRLITSLSLREVPPGANGGVTLWGLFAGFVGSLTIVSAALAFLPFCDEPGAEAGGGGGGGGGWSARQRAALAGALTVWGGLGSVLDSVLGGCLQRSVRDVPSGKIVEGEGGARVLVSTDRTRKSVAKFKTTTDVKAALLHGEGKGAVDKVSDPAEAGHHHPTRVVENGLDVLDNNQVNFLMALIMSTGAMVLAGWYWGAPLGSILRA